MKQILLTTIAAATLAISAASAADYTVFRVCEDQHVIRTSDGAEAGRVEYIVVEPSSHRIVSAVVKGGVLADKFVALPMTAFSFGGARDITLTNITRERLVSAPVFETTRLSTSAVIEPAFVERTYTHFGLDAAEITRASTQSTQERSGTRTSTERSTTTTPPSDAPDARGRARAEREGRSATPEPGTPGRDPNRSERAGSTPGQPETAPGRSGTTPGQRSTTPGQSDTAPGKAGTTPGQSNTAPGKAGTTPGQSDTTPGKPGTTPGQSDTSPGKAETTPGQSDTTPGKADTAPGKAGTAPGKREEQNTPRENKADPNKPVQSPPEASERAREKKNEQ